jgi:hypothetical protein
VSLLPPINYAVAVRTRQPWIDVTAPRKTQQQNKRRSTFVAPSVNFWHFFHFLFIYHENRLRDGEQIDKWSRGHVNSNIAVGGSTVRL